MNNFIKILEGIGLSKNSALIYLSLLEYGIISISELAMHTSLHRTQIYRLLPYLIESGFVFVIKKGKQKLYKPANPEKINEEYNSLMDINKRNISTLKQQYKNLDKKTNIVFRKGVSGIKNIYNDLVSTLGKGDVFYRITSETKLDKIKQLYQPKDYTKRRDQKKIERYIIMSEKTRALKKPKLEREERVIKKDIDDFDDNISFTIYDDKISFIDYNTEVSILIESKEIADFQKKIFKLLFKRL